MNTNLQIVDINYNKERKSESIAMKKEQNQIKQFIERTFGSQINKKGVEKSSERSRKQRKAKTELKLKVKVPQEQIIEENIQKLLQMREKSTIKTNVAQNITKKA